MFEYIVVNVHTEEERTIWGRYWLHACQKANIDPNDWVPVKVDFID